MSGKDDSDIGDEDPRKRGKGKRKRNVEISEEKPPAMRVKDTKVNGKPVVPKLTMRETIKDARDQKRSVPVADNARRSSARLREKQGLSS